MDQETPKSETGDLDADRQNEKENISESDADANRRGFMTQALAAGIGAVVGLFPLVVGLLVFLDPLRSRKKASGEESESDGFLRVAKLDELLIGKPRKYVVVDDRVDAWNLFPQEPVGAVYLLRGEDSQVTALNVICPHAGCFVDYDPDRTVYQCPCHDSSFYPDGKLANKNSPSARALDSLEVDPEKLKQGEVWIKYQNFRPGTAKKIAEE